jgi:hypothetical protein
MKKLAILAAGAVVLCASAAHAQPYYPGGECRYPGPAYSNDAFSNECGYRAYGYPSYGYPYGSYNAYYGDYPDAAVVVQPAPVVPFPFGFARPFHRHVFIRRY